MKTSNKILSVSVGRQYFFATSIAFHFYSAALLYPGYNWLPDCFINSSA